MDSFPRGKAGVSQGASSSSLTFSHNDELFGSSNERQGRLKRIDLKSGVKRKSSSLSSSSAIPASTLTSNSFGTKEAKDVMIEQKNSVLCHTLTYSTDVLVEAVCLRITEKGKSRMTDKAKSAFFL